MAGRWVAVDRHRAPAASKSDRATMELRELIVSGQLLPGVSLRQRELARRFGISATPVREALRRLEAEGLVASDANRGSTVAPLDVLGLEENLRILAVLEALAGRLAVERITAQDLDEIEALHAEVSAAAGDEARRTTCNRAFHFRIYACAASPTLLSIMRLLWASFPGGPQFGRPHAESVAQHARLIRALRRGDAAAVTRVIEAHAAGSAGYVRAQLGGPRTLALPRARPRARDRA